MKLHRVVFAFFVAGFFGQLLATPTINTQPASSSTIIGSVTSFSVAATGSGTLTYQWQGSIDNGSTWGPISNGAPFSGVTTATMIVSGPAYQYTGAKVRCVVTDSSDSSTATTDGTATLTITTPAPALILANPTNKSAFSGDVSPTTFAVLASGTSLTYAWQLSTDGGVTFPTTLTDTGAYSGTATATLSIADPFTNLGGATSGTPNTYRCVVSSGGYSVNSTAASLTIWGTPLAQPTVSFTVNGSPASSIASNDTSTVTVVITGVPASPNNTVRVLRYADLNGNGVIDPVEPLVQAFGVADGSVAKFSGVVDPNLPGDGNATTTPDGTINASFSLTNASELAKVAGGYIVRVVSIAGTLTQTGAFRSVDTPFSITQPALSQIISGTVTDGTNPIPYAEVALLQSNGDDQNVVGSVMAGSDGTFSANAAPGTYSVLPLALGYVANFGALPTANTTSGNVTGLTVTLIPATYTNTVQLQNNANGSYVRGVQLIMQSSTGYAALADTDNNGVAVAGAVADSMGWGFDMSSQSLSAIGYLRPQKNSDNGISLNSTVTTYLLQGVNALIYGTLKDNAANPLVGVNIQASDQNGQYEAETTTDANGNYYLAVYGSGGGWNVQPDNSDPIFASSHSPLYIAPSGQGISPLNVGSANVANFVAATATATLSGTVTKADHGNSAVSGVQMDLMSVVGQNVNFVSSVMTDSSGNFSFAASGGNWQIQMDSNSADSNNYVAPNLVLTVVDYVNQSGLAYAVKDGTGTVSGSVVDFSGAGLANANISASATINTVLYAASAQTDGTGHYSFPVINGTWTINAFASNGLFYPQHMVAISGSSTQTFSPSVFTTNPGNHSVTAGSSTNFSVGTNTPGGTTLQWQVSTDGGTTWTGLTDGGSYSGTATNNLNISSASVSLNGNKYRLQANFNYNSAPYIRFSNVGTLTVTGSAPVINSQPTSQSISANSGTNFSVSVTASPPATYQWYFSTDGGTTFGPLSNGGNFSGSQTTNLNINNAPTTLNGYQFYCVVTNGIAPDATSNTVTLTVNALTQTVNFPGPGDQTYVTFTIPLSASATSAGSIVYSIQSGPATVTGNQMTLTGIGTVVIRASQAGNSFYAPAFTDATIIVSKANATVFLNSLSATYDGSPKSLAPTTNPGSLSTSVTYNAVSTPPTNAGSYAVVVTVTDPNYQGSNSGTFVINKATASVNLGSLTATYDGSPKGIAPTTTPASLSYSVTYNGNPTVPTNAGSYGVIATVNDSNYQGSASGTFVINKATASVSFTSLSATYDGTPQHASTTTTPNGLTVNIAYSPGSIAPTNAGSYGVLATISDANYQGTVSDTFVVNQASQTISFTGPSDQAFSTTPITLSATGGASGNPVTFNIISGPATLSGTNNSTLTLIGAGTVTVEASQAGNANYLSAPVVDQSFNVGANFSSWAQSKFTADELLNHPELSGPSAVYGQDGLPNLVKYALGLEPKQNITTGLPTVTNDGTNWIYTYTRPTGLTDVTYSVEVSTDLTPASWSTTGTSAPIVNTSGGVDTVQVTYPIASASKLFFRLNVTQ